MFTLYKQHYVNLAT